LKIKKRKERGLGQPIEALKGLNRDIRMGRAGDTDLQKKESVGLIDLSGKRIVCERGDKKGKKRKRGGKERARRR